MFPLTGQLWLDWVADEQKIAATEEEKSKVRGKLRLRDSFLIKVLDLLERGVRDYLSVDLWLERCMVGMQGLGTPAGAAESRHILLTSILAGLNIQLLLQADI